MLADDEALIRFFDQRVAESVVNGKTFEAWRDFRSSGREEVYVGYSPIITVDADKILDDLPGKRLQVSGKVETYRDVPQIRGNEPSQIVRVQ